MSEIEFVPDYYSKWDIDHFSPSQDAKPLDNWFYEYCVNTQAWRRNKKPNPKGYYAYTKYEGEKIIKKFSKKYNYKY